MSCPTLPAPFSLGLTTAARDVPRFRLHKTLERSRVQHARIPFLYGAHAGVCPLALSEPENKARAVRIKKKMDILSANLNFFTTFLETVSSTLRLPLVTEVDENVRK